MVIRYCVPLQRSPQWITYTQWPITSQEALMSQAPSANATIDCKAWRNGDEACFHNQASFLGDVFILEKIPWSIILRNHLLRRNSHHLYFPHLWPLGRFLVLFKTQLKHLLSTIIAQRSSLTSFELSLFLSWCLHTWQIITLCVLDQIVNFSTSGIILYSYFPPCIRNTEVKW